MNGEYDEELRRRKARQDDLDAIVRRTLQELGITVTAVGVRGCFFYGAIGIDPRHLVVVYEVKADAEQTNSLRADLDVTTRKQLTANGYPADSVPKIQVTVVSNETARREAGGNYFSFLK